MSGLSSAQAAAQPMFEEDRARADFYAVIARLFYAAPDAALLAAIAGADEAADADGTAPLAAAWKVLGAAAAATDAEAVRLEYDGVFVGTGKAEITPYASHYLSESVQEPVLVRLRDTMAGLGLARRPAVAEYEDHFSSLCEVMRHLIAAGSGDVAVREQKSFFLEYLAPWYASFLAAALASPNTNFYRHVAGFAKVFLDVEQESFDIDQ